MNFWTKHDEFLNKACSTEWAWQWASHTCRSEDGSFDDGVLAEVQAEHCVMPIHALVPLIRPTARLV